MVSTMTDYHVIIARLVLEGIDLPSILFLHTYAATAWSPSGLAHITTHFLLLA